MKRIFSGIGGIFLAVLKAIAWLIVHVLYLILEVAKLFLLLFGLIGRVFLAFVRAATP